MCRVSDVELSIWGRAPGAPCAGWLRTLRYWALVGCLALVPGCKSEAAPEPVPATKAAPAKAEQFSFKLPPSFFPLELRGEGSETLQVPVGTRVEQQGNTFKLEASPEFALVVEGSAPPFEQIKAELASARVVFEGDDVVVVERGSGYAFVALRELVPEWDESDRRRISCSSAGFERAGSKAGALANARSFSRPAIEAMVAACLSLELPKLE
jgi:hypothetical protein